jgi:hypothetical protein
MLSGLIKFTQATAQQNHQQMEPDDCIAIDGSSDHCRNAGMHPVDVTECWLGRVVDFESVAKKANFRDGNFDEHSYDMEVAGFKRLFSRWPHDPNAK